MAAWKDKVFDDWWPLAQSMLLVRGSVVAQALEADARRRGRHKEMECSFQQIDSIRSLFESVKFTLGPTLHYVLPTTGSWSVIWDNGALCTGHDSMAYCLTNFQRLTTLHFYSTDRNSTQLAGTQFTWRQPGGEGLLERLVRFIRKQDRKEGSERNVYCCNQGKRWHFEQHGEPLAEEDLARYDLKRKRDRLNEETFMALLDRIGIHPWREATYDFSQPVFRVGNLLNLGACETFSFAQVRGRASGEPPPPADDQELHGPPDYLAGKCQAPAGTGPARLLADGRWCGHREETFWIYDIALGQRDRFRVRLSQQVGPPAVAVAALDGEGEFSYSA